MRSADAAPGRSRIRAAAPLLGVRHGGAAGRRAPSPTSPTGPGCGSCAVPTIPPALDGDRATSSRQFGGLLAIDQAYLEFGGVDRSPLVRERDDTVVIRSMSKAFALAGARVGYILAPEALAAQLDAIRLPAGISVDLGGAGRDGARERRRDARNRGRHRGRARPHGGGADRRRHRGAALVHQLPAARRRTSRARSWPTRLIAQGLIVRTSSRSRSWPESIRISPATPASNDLLLQALGAAPAPAAGEPCRVARVQRHHVRDRRSTAAWRSTAPAPRRSQPESGSSTTC